MWLVLLSGSAMAMPAAAGPGDVAAGSHEQPPGDEDPNEGRPIREVVLRRPIEGRAGEYAALEPDAEQLARNQVRSVSGTPFNAAGVAEDVRRLTRLGRYALVKSEVQRLSDGSVRLVFTVSPQPIILDVQPVGNRVVNDQKIAELARPLAGTAVDQFTIDRVCRDIEDEYRTKGYYLAQVTADQEELAESGVLILRVREGDRLKVMGVRYEGNRSFTPRELGVVVRTRTAGVLEIFGKGPLDDDVVRSDVAALASFYQDRGHLDVRVDSRVTPAPNNREAIVTFLVDEGRVYTLRSVRVVHEGLPEGAEGVLGAAQIAGLIGIKAGDVYSADKLRKADAAVREAYGKMGYVDAQVRRVERRDGSDPFVDLELIVAEGDRAVVGQIIIRGNETTKQEVLLRQMQVRPGRPLDTTAVDESKRRLKNLRLFAADPNTREEDVRITLAPPDPTRPGVRDVIAEVTEGPTGFLNFGAAVSSDASVVGLFSYTQKNFDITDTPDSVAEFFANRAFRGAGQTFSIDLQPGLELSQYSASLTEPYLFETDISGTGSLFFRERDFTEYDERRGGVRLGLGRRFGSRWVANASLRAEQVDTFNFEPDVPVEILRFEGDQLLTGVGLRLTRTSADDLYLATRGNSITLGVEQVGALGGDADFTRLSADYAVYIPLREDFVGRRTVLRLGVGVDYIPQDESKVPVFERFYHGGSSMRGFGFRAVSPLGVRADNGLVGNDPVGGTWSFFAGAELRQPVFRDIVSVVGFIDSGTVTYTPGFDDYRVSVGAGLRLHVKEFSPVPIAVDFGFPIIYEGTDRFRLFTFSIDVPFQ